VIMRLRGVISHLCGTAMIEKLGRDLRDARRRRRISTTTMAARARISRSTLYRIEQGDPSVSMSSYTAVIFALGLLNRLRDAFDASHDVVGLGLEAENMPKNITNKHYGS
ncbi:MAG: helix-turn-helix domain-containing protein, partial [Akkermansia muciniphila]